MPAVAHRNSVRGAALAQSGPGAAPPRACSRCRADECVDSADGVVCAIRCLARQVSHKHRFDADGIVDFVLAADPEDLGVSTHSPARVSELIYEITFGINHKPLFIRAICSLCNAAAKSLFGQRNYIDPPRAFTYSGAEWEKVGQSGRLHGRFA